MANNDKIIADTATALASIDVATENARIVELEAQTTEFDIAIDKAEARFDEIVTIMRDWEGPDGAAVADALMASDAQTAGRTGPDFEALKAERQALRFGVGELRRRIQACSDEIRVIKRETCAKVAGHLADPLVAVLEADAIAAARSFVAAYASIIALTEATKSGRAAKIKWEIEEAVRYLFKFEGFRTANGPVIEIPKDIRAMLRAMEVKGVALPNRLPETLPIPW